MKNVNENDLLHRLPRKMLLFTVEGNGEWMNGQQEREREKAKKAAVLAVTRVLVFHSFWRFDCSVCIFHVVWMDIVIESRLYCRRMFRFWAFDCLNRFLIFRYFNLMLLAAILVPFSFNNIHHPQLRKYVIRSPAKSITKQRRMHTFVRAVHADCLHCCAFHHWQSDFFLHNS